MKLCSLTEFFVYNVSGEVMAKFCQDPELCQKVRPVHKFQFQQSNRFLIAITHKPLTVWSRIRNHRKGERVS
jgi:hypothetical protein